MGEPWERLQQARRKAGFEQAVDAARAYGWSETTYTSHENGTRGLRPDVAARYAKAFKVSPEWLLYERGRQAQKNAPAAKRMAPLVGYVGASAEAHYVPAGELGTVEAPAGSTESTVAVEIRGDSLGPLFDRWLVFYDDVRRPVTADLIGRLCVVGLEDGRHMVKKIRRSKTKGLFHLISNTEAPILDVAIEWAALVKTMVPR